MLPSEHQWMRQHMASGDATIPTSVKFTLSDKQRHVNLGFVWLNAGQGEGSPGYMKLLLFFQPNGSVMTAHFALKFIAPKAFFNA